MADDPEHEHRVLSSRAGDRLVMINSDPEDPKILVRAFPAGTRKISSISLEHGFPETIFDVDQELSQLVTLYPNDYLYPCMGPGNWPGGGYLFDRGSPVEPPYDDRLIQFEAQPGQHTPGHRRVGWVSFPVGRAERQTAAHPEGHTAPFGWDAMAFSPDGALLATANLDGSLRIWTPTEESCCTSCPATALPNVSFSPDGKRLLATGEGTAIHLWMCKPVRALTLPESSTLVNNLGISSGRLIPAAAHLDGTVQLWMPAPAWSCSACRAFICASGRRKHLITFKEEAIYGLTLDIDELMEMARARLTRSWTPDECSKFLHTETCPPPP
jgi:WD40 repeat protein